MNEPELKRLLSALDDAAAIFFSHEGPLSAREVSTRSMLNVVRRQVSEELARVRAVVAGPGE